MQPMAFTEIPKAQFPSLRPQEAHRTVIVIKLTAYRQQLGLKSKDFGDTLHVEKHACCSIVLFLVRLEVVHDYNQNNVVSYSTDKHSLV